MNLNEVKLATALSKQLGAFALGGGCELDCISGMKTKAKLSSTIGSTSGLGLPGFSVGSTNDGGVKGGTSKGNGKDREP